MFAEGVEVFHLKRQMHQIGRTLNRARGWVVAEL
jgi:hypothetical protein